MVPSPTSNLGFEKHSKQHPYFAKILIDLILHIQKLMHEWFVEWKHEK
jgi:hypothetical protein